MQEDSIWIPEAQSSRPEFNSVNPTSHLISINTTFLYLPVHPYVQSLKYSSINIMDSQYSQFPKFSTQQSQFSSEVCDQVNVEVSKRKKIRGAGFNKDEDRLLFSAWLNTSMDAIHGNEQKRHELWNITTKISGSTVFEPTECCLNDGKKIKRRSIDFLDVLPL